MMINRDDPIRVYLYTYATQLRPICRRSFSFCRSSIGPAVPTPRRHRWRHWYALIVDAGLLAEKPAHAPSAPPDHVGSVYGLRRRRDSSVCHALRRPAVAARFVCVLRFFAFRFFFLLFGIRFFPPPAAMAYSRFPSATDVSFVSRPLY